MLFLLILFYWDIYTKWYPKNTTEFAQQVLEVNPGANIEKWQLISSNLNTYFYQKRIWSTPYFFFNGVFAQQVFRNNVLNPYLNGKFNNTANTYHIESLKNYLKSLKTFESYLKDDLPELASESELPKETHRSGFNKGHFDLFFPFCSIESLTVWALLMAYKKKSYVHLILAIIYQLMLLFNYHINFRFTYLLMGIIQGIKSLKVIAKVRREQSLDKWDEIARYMNQYLAYEGNFERSSVKFYDGRHCLSFYKRYFEPLSVGNNRLMDADLKEIVEITQPYVA